MHVEDEKVAAEATEDPSEDLEADMDPALDDEAGDAAKRFR